MLKQNFFFSDYTSLVINLDDVVAIKGHAVILRGRNPDLMISEVDAGDLANAILKYLSEKL